MTIQDYLVAQGYEIDHAQESFVKKPSFANAWAERKIPFEAIAGHTLESFKAKAEKERWITKTSAVIFCEDENPRRIPQAY